MAKRSIKTDWYKDAAGQARYVGAKLSRGQSKETPVRMDFYKGKRYTGSIEVPTFRDAYYVMFGWAHRNLDK